MEKDKEQSLGDLLYGVPAIAEYLGIKARQVYHLVEKGDLPTFKLKGVTGKTCARRSTLDQWLKRMEASNAG